MRKFILSLVVLCLWCGASPVFAQLDDATTVQVATDLNKPIYAISPPGDYERLFVVDEDGRIEILNLLDGEVNDDSFLDITDQVNSSGERGFLCVGFPDDFLTEGFFFVYYTDDGPDNGSSTISRFEVDADDEDLADESTEEILLLVDQPFSNHNGGTILFKFDDDDEFLYFGLGDGGSLSDPDGNAQSGDTLLGKMIRLDVSDYTAGSYVVPSDNPFTATADPLNEIQDEIWHIGVRNPWRWTFDPDNGDMYIADVGEVGEEEISVVEGTSGENLGWRCREGLLCTEFADCDCDDVYFDPIESYETNFPQCAIIGGFVYRGDAIPDFDGYYIYADWCSGDMWALLYDRTLNEASEIVQVNTTIAPGMGQVIDEIAGFGRDAYGELYICDRGGEIYKIIPDDFDGDDCNENNILDSKEVEFDVALDCNNNGTIDSCDTDSGESADINSNSIPDECEEFLFVRSDVDGDGDTDIEDLFTTLEYMFEGEEGLCVDGMDFNDDGILNLTDVFESAAFTFLSGPDPAAPYPDCAEDTTEDQLDCAFHTTCE